MKCSNKKLINSSCDLQNIYFVSCLVRDACASRVFTVLTILSLRTNTLLHTGMRQHSAIGGWGVDKVMQETCGSDATLQKTEE